MYFELDTAIWLKLGIGDWSIPAVDLECLLERTLAAVTPAVAAPAQYGRIRLGLPV